MARARAEKREAAHYLKDATGEDLDVWLLARHDEGMSALRIRDEFNRVTGHAMQNPPVERTFARWIESLLAEAA